MSKEFFIDPSWERLDRGSPEEKACFALLGVRCHGAWLTEAEDAFVKTVRKKVYLSAYLLAEWLAWNWWRLRWEPRRKSIDWAMAHRISTIGSGYVWPNITITSDGVRVVIQAEPTVSRPAEPLRYVANNTGVVQANEFDNAIDAFVSQVLGRLEAFDITDTNLNRVWGDLLSERSDPDCTVFRKFEALLGFDPGDADPNVINRLISESKELGKGAMEEIAAANDEHAFLDTAKKLSDLAKSAGTSADLKDFVKLDANRKQDLPTKVAAWKRGGAAAKALQAQLRLTAPISSEALCEMAGISTDIITNTRRTSPFSFSINEKASKASFVLRSKYATGRRFALARLIGDRITQNGQDCLFPATEAITYRQKQQRAFAAELLCPFESLTEKLEGDFSDEAMEDAAHYFEVSPLTVKNTLLNHNLLERESCNNNLLDRSSYVEALLEAA